jgi:hypothetical protein
VLQSVAFSNICDKFALIFMAKWLVLSAGEAAICIEIYCVSIACGYFSLAD